MNTSSLHKNLDNVFKSHIGNLNDVLDKLKEDDSARAMAPGFKLEEVLSKIDAALKSLSFDATKLAMVFKQPPLPKPEDCNQMLAGAEGRIIVLVSLFYGIPKESGVTLRKALKKVCLSVVSGLHELLQRIMSDRYQSSQELLSSTGSVWAACERLEAAPKDNKEAVLAEIQADMDLVKDALEELAEAQNSDGEGMDDFMDDLEAAISGDEPNPFQAPRRGRMDREKAVLIPVSGLTKACKNCLKKCRGAVKVNGRITSAEEIGQLDKIVEASSKISPHLDELVSGVYPPVGMASLQTNAIQLTEVMHDVLDKTQGSHVCSEGDLQWIHFLHKAINHNLEQLQNITKQQVGG
ncbi:cyclin-D1-binding protein 1 homolog [Apostichopus japonicus]|uniref:cyclin-D1-binding protein 1 homolog n=1 Tax=Stichopus japonicus TaxID=307972 RepID=UPI003AB53F17